MRSSLHRAFAVIAPIVVAGALFSCSWDPGRIFDRPDPAVERARGELEASIADGDADLAASRLALEELLRFRCEADGGEDRVVKLPGASLDLGLVVFRVAELVGQRFGDEEVDAGEAGEAIARRRAEELDCAQRFLMKLAGDSGAPRDLVLRARYLLGNLAFLSRRYRDAIARYDEVLLAHPARGVTAKDAGPGADDDAIARDAAWNRAIALQRLEDQKNDAGPDTPDAPDTSDSSDGADSQDGSDSPDAPDGSDADDAKDASDAPDTGASDGPDGGGSDGGDTGGSADGGSADTGADGGADASSPKQPQPAPTTKASSGVGVDLRELDRFEKQAPLDLELRRKVKVPVPKAYDK